MCLQVQLEFYTRMSTNLLRIRIPTIKDIIKSKSFDLRNPKSSLLVQLTMTNKKIEYTQMKNKTENLSHMRGQARLQKISVDLYEQKS